jgi:hypothetical protein
MSTLAEAPSLPREWDHMSEIDTTGSLGVLIAAGRLLRPGCGNSEALRALIDFLLFPSAALAEGREDLPENVRSLLFEVGSSGNAQGPDNASQAATRALLVFAEAVELFGNEASAWTWWTTPLRRDGDVAAVAPSAIVGDAAGAAELISRIRRTGQGIF